MYCVNRAAAAQVFSLFYRLYDVVLNLQIQNALKNERQKFVECGKFLQTISYRITQLYTLTLVLAVHNLLQLFQTQ